MKPDEKKPEPLLKVDPKCYHCDGCHQLFHVGEMFHPVVKGVGKSFCGMCYSEFIDKEV